jgi:hypothetical protein
MKQSTWILLGILLVLIVAAYLVLQRTGERSTSGSTGKMLVEYDSAAVDKIDISGPSGHVVLERQGGAWMLTDPLRYKADPGLVGSAISAGNKIELTSLISTNPEKQGLFKLDSTGTLVKIMEQGSEKAVFLIGKPGPSYTETYVRREGSDNVYLAAGYFSTAFSRRGNDWRDKTIFKTDEDAINSVTMHYGDTTFTITRTDTLWMIDGQRAKDDVIHTFMSALADLKTDEFIDTTVASLPKLTAEIDVMDTQLRFFWKKEGDRYYVLSSRSPQLYQLYSWKVTSLLKRKKDFLAAPKA